MNPWIFLTMTLLVAPAFGQTMYRFSDESGVVKYQQIPCTPTGGGEAIPVKKLPGSGEGLRPEEASALDNLTAHNAAVDKARAAAEEKAREERKRAEALDVEKSKAAAQWETARAIWATGGR